MIYYIIAVIQAYECTLVIIYALCVGAFTTILTSRLNLLVFTIRITTIVYDIMLE